MIRRVCMQAAVLAALPVLAGAQLVRQPNATLNLPADLPVATGYVTENTLGSLTFSAPMCTAFPPGETSRLFVAERGGMIQAVTGLTGTPAKSAYLSLGALLGPGESLRTDGENGFLSLAFHPQFAANGTLFVYYSLQVVEGASNRLFQRLARIVVSNPASQPAAVVSHTPLLTMFDEATNHNGGDLHFGADGFLYLSLGDEGGGGDTYNNARFINKDFWGQLLRLDVDNLSGNLAPNTHSQPQSTTFPSAVHAGTYRVPADNPFVGCSSWHNVAINPASVRTEIYATGLRNPFRWSFDPPTGRLFLADVGQGTYEEIDLVTIGADLGWSWREGQHAYPSPPAPTTPPATGFTPVEPVYEYDHTNNGIGNDAVIYGNSVTGGAVYRGNRLTELNGAYIFADYASGIIAALRENAGAWTGQRLATDSGIVDFGINPADGDLILCDLSAGRIKRLARSGTAGSPPPATLSATGAFASLASLTPHAGIVPYEPNVAFWSDHARKSRWFSIRNLADTVGFSAYGSWSFPAGMVWIKHFDIETTRGDPATRRKLETRFLVKTAADVYGLSYKWRADQSDADLVAEQGLSEAIPNSNPPQSWRFPSRAECRICHTPVGGFALSFNTRQMNRSNTYGGLAQNQIAALSEAGYFTAPVAGVHNLPAFARADDATQSLEWRVRSYLAVNCVQCHQPGGGVTGNWDARPTTPTDNAALINGPLANQFGDPANRFAVPGDVARSMVLRRLQGAGVPRMPPLATSERDLAAEQLLTDWIVQALPARQSFAQWQVAHFGSTAAAAAQPGADPDYDGAPNSLEYLARTLPLGAASRFAATLAGGAPGQLQLAFTQPAGTSCLIETTTDLAGWTTWDVPGNAPSYPAADLPCAVAIPAGDPRRFFRLRLSRP